MGGLFQYFLKVFAIFTLISTVFGGYHNQHHHQNHYRVVDYYAEPKYHYSYGVKDKYTNDYKTAHEERDGHYTKGSYSVLLPNGIIQKVVYTSTPWDGFKATIHHIPYHQHHHHESSYHHHQHKHVGPTKAIVIKKPHYPHHSPHSHSPPGPPHHSPPHSHHHHHQPSHEPHHH